MNNNENSKSNNSNKNNFFNGIVKTQQEATPMPDKVLRELGGLIFQVTTDSGATPLENVMITVRRKLFEDIFFLKELFTNEDGKTDIIYVNAPPIDMSLSPNGLTPYYVYEADIEANGYYLVEKQQIQIFEGVTTIQPVDLTRIEENEGNRSNK